MGDGGAMAPLPMPMPDALPTWVDAMPDLSEMQYDNEDGTWHPAPFGHLYTASMLWALTTMSTISTAPSDSDLVSDVQMSLAMSQKLRFTTSAWPSLSLGTESERF